MPGPSVHQGPAASDCGCGQGPGADLLPIPGTSNAPECMRSAAGYGAGYDPYGAYGTYDGYGPAGYLPAQQYASNSSILGINYQDGQFWKGAVLGAAITLLVTNESVQRGIIKGAAKIYGTVQGRRSGNQGKIRGRPGRNASAGARNNRRS